MKFFAFSALATIAAANTYYGGARLATTGLTTGYTTGLTGLSTGYTTGLAGLSTGYSTLAAPAYTTGYSTLAVPAVQKVAVVAQPSIAVQKVGLAGLGYAGGYTYGSAAVAPLAVQTTHQVQYADVPSGGQINPISVDIAANPIPINMVFRSASSQLNVEQAHQGAAGSVQESASEDETHVLRHSVTKPVLQEVREVVTPFRKITQEVQPVREEINTIVARGVNQAVVARAAPIAVQTVAAPVAAYEKVIAAPVATVQTVAAPIQTLAATQYVARPATQLLTSAAPIALQKTYGTIGTIGAVNTIGRVNTLVKEY